LADEYGWGNATSLTVALRKLYGVTELKNIMQALYKHKITPAQISRAAPVVLEQAAAHDIQALEIVNNVATKLCHLVATMVNMSDLSHCEVHAWGGIFKSDFANMFIKKIEHDPVVKQRHIKLINQAHCNVTTLFAQSRICKSSGSLLSLWEAARTLFLS